MVIRTKKSILRDQITRLFEVIDINDTKLQRKISKPTKVSIIILSQILSDPLIFRTFKDSKFLKVTPVPN